MRNPGRTIVIAFIACLIMGNNATAQIGSPGIMYQGAFNNAMFLTTKSAIERGMKSGTGRNRGKDKRSGTVVSDLNFVSSAKVHDSVLELIGTIAANGNKSKAKSASETIKNANFLAQFDSILRPYGFNRHNVPDVFAAFIILSWQAISGGEAGNYRKGIELCRTQMHNAMSNNNALSQFRNDQKQEISEILSYMAIFFTYACQEQFKKGDRAALVATRHNIRQAVIRVSGIDLAKYAFNNNGLVEN